MLENKYQAKNKNNFFFLANYRVEKPIFSSKNVKYAQIIFTGETDRTQLLSNDNKLDDDKNHNSKQINKKTDSMILDKYEGQSNTSNGLKKSLLDENSACIRKNEKWYQQLLAR